MVWANFVSKGAFESRLPERGAVPGDPGDDRRWCDGSWAPNSDGVRLVAARQRESRRREGSTERRSRQKKRGALLNSLFNLLKYLEITKINR